MHRLLGECDDEPRTKAEISPAPDLFQLTGLALGRINIQFAPVLLGSGLSQQLGASEGPTETGGDVRSFFRGSWLSEALSTMAQAQKGKVF